MEAHELGRVRWQEEQGWSRWFSVDILIRHVKPAAGYIGLEFRREALAADINLYLCVYIP